MEADILLLLPLELPFCFRCASVMRVKLLCLSAPFPQTLEHIYGKLPFCFRSASVLLPLPSHSYNFFMELLWKHFKYVVNWLGQCLTGADKNAKRAKRPWSPNRAFRKKSLPFRFRFIRFPGAPWVCVSSASRLGLQMVPESPFPGPRSANASEELP